MNKIFFLIIFLTFQFCDRRTRVDDSKVEFLAISSQPVISTLFNTRVLILLKGTYATDNPNSMEDYNDGTNQLYRDDESDGPAFNLTSLPTASGLQFYIDVGEIRISSKFAKGVGELVQLENVKDTKAFWDRIAPVRQVYCTQPYPINFTDSNTCVDQNGIYKMFQFLNGYGVEYPSNDPTAENYQSSSTADSITSQTICGSCGTQYYYTGVYLRSLYVNWAVENGALVTTNYFDNYQTPGVNIVPRNNYVPGLDPIIKEITPPKLFPLLYSLKPGQADMTLREGNDPVLFEVRMNLKESWMVNSYTDSSGIVETLVSISDWKYNQKGESDMGGNLLLRSRFIYPEFAYSLEIKGGTRSRTHYYSVYRKEEVDILQELPLAATPVYDGSSTIQYLNPGDYTLYCLGDITRRDGMPDTIVRQTTFNVPDTLSKGKITLDLTCP